MDYLKLVKEFHTTFDHPVVALPAIPDEKRQELRIALLQEELNELKSGIEAKDLVEIADAFADLQYVLAGAIIEFGMADRFNEIFQEVHRSNMSKSCETEQIANETAMKSSSEGTSAYVKSKLIGDGLGFGEDKLVWQVFRTRDDKLIKSLKYSPANIADIVNRSEDADNPY